MENQKLGIWVGTEDLNQDPVFAAEAEKEFKQDPTTAKEDSSLAANRRDFLKYLGFGLGAATVAAACDTPVRRAIPYVTKPDAIVPGVATYYASSFVKGGDYCPVLVKTREGRPIKIEGNSLSSITGGGTSARAQASVLGLYDTARLRGPLAASGDGKFAKSTWADLDAAVAGKLRAGSRIRIVTNTILSPSTKRALAEFTAKFPSAKVVTYDPVSASALLQANEANFGVKAVPSYKFDKADVIAAFNCDFLGTWISPIEYAKDYATRRKITSLTNANMSRHYQVEGHMSMTGSNADNRILVKPSEQGVAIAALLSALGGGGASAAGLNDKAAAQIKAMARDLQAHRGSSIVVSGSNNKGEQIMINKINNLLGNYGSTISFTGASNQRQGIDADIQALVREMQSGSVDALIVMGANPAFDIPNAAAFVEGAANVGLKVSFAGLMDETTALCDYIAPTGHFLESWGDAEPKKGYYSLIQPTIHPLFDTRDQEVSLLSWAGSGNLNKNSDQPYYDYVKQTWSGLAANSDFGAASAFWDNALHDGVFEAPRGAGASSFSDASVGSITKPNTGDGMEVAFYETVNMGAGQYATNPWLTEMPDPVTRTTWGNYLAIPVSWDGVRLFKGMNGLNVEDYRGQADIVSLDVNGNTQNVTVVKQFGLKEGTLALALGHGRSVVGEAGRNVGVNTYPWMSIDADGNTQYFATVGSVSPAVAEDELFPCVQYHHTMGVKGIDEATQEVINADEAATVDDNVLARMLGMQGFQGALTKRSVIRQGDVKDLEKFATDLVHEREHHQKLNSYTLYPDRSDVYGSGHHWGMYVDLNACIGCGACQVACIAENNVPVVGKTEVARHHEMTWMRIDRYYYGDYENPNVVYQPMMCQHCDNAPCENVCPVAATNHSSEGLNQMTYNRCIGTRYCANNCPYKVRRFNWLDYTTADLFPSNEYEINGEEIPFGADNLTRMVLNPDVTVRSRGVIEKCSFCVQRIQEGKLTAKREQRKLVDSDVRSACQTACPTGAITFGDMNNPEAPLAQKMKSALAYKVLEEINVLSSVHYSAKITNKNEALS